MPGGKGAQKPGATGPLELNVAKLTDVGRARDHNEDYVDFYIPPDPQQLARKGAIYLVADGMGGHQAGEVASQGAVELAVGQYYSDKTHEVGTSLVRAFRAANQLIHEQAQVDPSKKGMGTTLVAAVILGRKVYVANVGDSRAYLINKKGITQITEDHSWVEEQVRAGLLTPDQARRHPQRNVVTRALGSKPAVEVDLFEGEINEGDALLLCTDGLTGHVEDQELATIVGMRPPQQAAQSLVALANERGGHDNIGVVIVSAQKEATTVASPVPVAAPAKPKPEKKRRRVSPLIPTLAVVALALLGVGGYLLGQNLGLFGEGTPTAVAFITATNTPTEMATALPPPTDTAIQPTTTPVASPLPVASGEVVTGTATTPEATSTLAATPSVAPTSTPQPTNTPRPTAAQPTPTQTPTRYPAPVLLTPEAEAALSGEQTFTWQWDHEPLAEGYYFDLRIWSQDEEDAGTEPQGVVAPTRDAQATFHLDEPEPLGKGGIYYWGVVVVYKPDPGSNPVIAGEWSEERPFTYQPPSAGSPKERPPKPGGPEH
jgi:serine/threonine protein phosphatase PrpC